MGCKCLRWERTFRCSHDRAGQDRSQLHRSVILSIKALAATGYGGEGANPRTGNVHGARTRDDTP